MVNLGNVIENLKEWGFYDVILPFILTYVIIFAILEKSGIFKPKDGKNENLKSVHAVISLVFGLFVVASVQTVKYIQNYLTIMSTLIIFLLAVFIVLAFVFGEDYMQIFMEKVGGEWKIRSWAAWTVGLATFIFALSVVLWVFGLSDSVLWFFSDLDFSDDTFGTIVIIVAIVAVLYWVSKGSSDDKSSSKK